MIDSIFTLLIIGVLACCLAQGERYRQHAGYVYGLGIAVHFLFFRGMDLYSINYYWNAYYLLAGVIGLFIVIGLQNLPDYTKFHRRLQQFALASIVINGGGGLAEYANISPHYYSGISFTLYFLLIGELLRNGRCRRISRNSGFYNYFRSPTL